MTFPTAAETHLAIALALRELHAGGFDTAARRYAATAWPGHELGAGDPTGAVYSLAFLSDTAQPRETRDRWAAHAPTITTLLEPDHPDTLAARHNLAFWRGEAGDAAGSANAFAELLPIRERVLGPEHPVLTGVHFADDGVTGFADGVGVKRPRPRLAGGAVVGVVTGCSAW